MALPRLNKGGAASEAAFANTGHKARAARIPLIEPSARGFAARERRWGVILAGGDDTRLRALTKFVCGDERPKQFCPLLGDVTLLGQTIARARQSVPARQILISLAGEHAKFYSGDAARVPAQCIVQPMDKGTAPPIVHGLLSIARRDEEAVVAILPSDHYFSDDVAFAATLDSAFEAAGENADAVILIGVRAEHPEIDGGWIKLGAPLLRGSGSELFRAHGLQEKPAAKAALALFEQGAVWNTFIMVGNVQAFLRIIEVRAPDLLDRMSRSRLWAGEETHIEYSLYGHLSSSGFSNDILRSGSGRLHVLRMNDIRWSDLGDLLRVTSVILETEPKPVWFERWTHAKGVAASAARRSEASA